MLIQCQTCNSKYRLNLERIPNRKTFIKCRKCNAPIYIDPQEEMAGEEGALQAASAAAAVGGTDGDGAVVACDECSARYRVPLHTLQKPGLKLRCTHCGHTFPVPEVFLKALTAAPETTGEAPAMEPEGAGPEFFPAAAEDGTSQRDAAGREMPLPDDARMDAMFDDLQVDKAAGGGANTPEQALQSTAAESERAYLEAVSFGEGEKGYARPGAGSIPDDKKYRFFLNPNESAGQADAEDGEPGVGEAGEAEPRVEAEEDLPPLPPDEGVAEVPPTEETGVPPLEVPQFESEFPEETGMTEPTDLDPTLPPLVIDQPEQQEAHGSNPAVPGQEPPPGPEENRNFYLMVAAVAVVALFSAGWGFWIWSLPSASEPFTVREGKPPQLNVTATREGYFVTNKPSGERLYVLTGQLVNGFAAEERVGWVRLKGIAYDNSGKPTREGHTYVGNMLSDQQLASWSLSAIQAYYGYVNGREDANFEIPQGETVAYQIVLKGVRPPVARSEARVVSLLQKGRPVYLEHY